jgi:hypothetical protein
MGWADKAFVLYYSHATKRSREEAANRWKGLLAEKPRTASVSEIDTAANPLETDQEMLASRFD